MSLKNQLDYSPRDYRLKNEEKHIIGSRLSNKKPPIKTLIDKKKISLIKKILTKSNETHSNPNKGSLYENIDRYKAYIKNANKYMFTKSKLEISDFLYDNSANITSRGEKNSSIISSGDEILKRDSFYNEELTFDALDLDKQKGIEKLFRSQEPENKEKPGRDKVVRAEKKTGLDFSFSPRLISNNKDFFTFEDELVEDENLDNKKLSKKNILNQRLLQNSEIKINDQKKNQPNKFLTKKVHPELFNSQLLPELNYDSLISSKNSDHSYINNMLNDSSMFQSFHPVSRHSRSLNHNTVIKKNINSYLNKRGNNWEKWLQSDLEKDQCVRKEDILNNIVKPEIRCDKHIMCSKNNFGRNSKCQNEYRNILLRQKKNINKERLEHSITNDYKKSLEEFRKNKLGNKKKVSLDEFIEISKLDSDVSPMHITTNSVDVQTVLNERVDNFVRKLASPNKHQKLTEIQNHRLKSLSKNSRFNKSENDMIRIPDNFNAQNNNRFLNNMKLGKIRVKNNTNIINSKLSKSLYENKNVMEYSKLYDQNKNMKGNLTSLLYGNSTLLQGSSRGDHKSVDKADTSSKIDFTYFEKSGSIFNSHKFDKNEKSRKLISSCGSKERTVNNFETTRKYKLSSKKKTIVEETGFRVTDYSKNKIYKYSGDNCVLYKQMPQRSYINYEDVLTKSDVEIQNDIIKTDSNQSQISDNDGMIRQGNLKNNKSIKSIQNAIHDIMQKRAWDDYNSYNEMYGGLEESNEILNDDIAQIEDRQGSEDENIVYTPTNIGSNNVIGKQLTSLKKERQLQDKPKLL